MAVELGSHHAFFPLPAAIRKAIHTPNSAEALLRPLRKIIRTRGAFPNEESALKVPFLRIRQASRIAGAQLEPSLTNLWPQRMPQPDILDADEVADTT